MEAADRLIRFAIRHHRLIQFRYHGTSRIAEPHDYGISAGHVRLFVFQTGGESKQPIPGWRMMEVASIEDLVVLDESFPGSRSRDGQVHKNWDELFLRVE